MRESPSHRTFRSSFACLAFGLLSSPVLLSSPANADENVGDDVPPPAMEDYRDDARRLATEAAERYQAGEYASALDLFVRADKLYDAPTLKFWQARCYEQLGRLVDAEARYADVARANFPDDAPEAFIQAQRDSQAALEQLRKRLPTLKIIINRAKDISRVELDGRVLPAPLIGAPIAVDPGTHIVRVTRSSGAVRTESVAIVESQAQEVYVDFEAPAGKPLTPLIERDDTGDRSSADWQTSTGFAALLGGTVGIGLGVFAGLKAMDQYRVVEENCTDACQPSQHDELDSFRRWRTVSTIGYAFGVVGLGAGAVLLLTRDNGPSFAVRVHPNGASLHHRF